MTKDDLIAKATELGLSEGNDLASMNKEQLQGLIDGAGDNNSEEDLTPPEDFAPTPDTPSREEIEAEIRAEVEAETKAELDKKDKEIAKLKKKEARLKNLQEDRAKEFEAKGKAYTCKHCETKTFSENGKCHWCYKELGDSKEVKPRQGQL